MKLITEQVGLLEVNCSFIQPEQGAELTVIDPGGDAEKILEIMLSFEAPSYRILLTHAHVDHISAAGAVVKRFPGTKVYLCPADLKLYQSPMNALPPIIPAAEDLPMTHWPPPEMEGQFQTIATPGHTRGGVCYYYPREKLLFSGDTLFAGSIGRTDLPGDGDFDTIIRSIKTRLFTLPDDVRVVPGHGADTTIAREKIFNPYFAEH